MKIINRNDYMSDGVFINLDISYRPYENLINNHKMYLNKNTKYYIYCFGGVKSKKVVQILEAYGYDVTYVKNVK